MSELYLENEWHEKDGCEQMFDEDGGLALEVTEVGWLFYRGEWPIASKTMFGAGVTLESIKAAAVRHVIENHGAVVNGCSACLKKKSCNLMSLCDYHRSGDGFEAALEELKPSLDEALRTARKRVEPILERELEAERVDGETMNRRLRDSDAPAVDVGVDVGHGESRSADSQAAQDGDDDE